MKLYMVVTSLPHRDSAKCCISKLLEPKRKREINAHLREMVRLFFFRKELVGRWIHTANLLISNTNSLSIFCNNELGCIFLVGTSYVNGHITLGSSFVCWLPEFSVWFSLILIDNTPFSNVSLILINHHLRNVATSAAVITSCFDVPTML